MRMTGFEPPAHVKVVCRLLQRMEEDWATPDGKQLDRVMVFMPPRAAKTTLCTILFPAWLIGRRPATALMFLVGLYPQSVLGFTNETVKRWVALLP